MFVSLVFAAGCHGSTPALVEVDRARHLADEMRVQFNKASDAADRAVMADTDEASVGFANDARSATGVVKQDAALLEQTLHDLGYENESALMSAFDGQFAQYQVVLHEILELAVENTNLKAQRLSFGPGREAADGFRKALVSLGSSVGAKDACRAEHLIADASLAVREIQVLQAPHIAEANDAAMTQMEKEMNDRRTIVSDALEALAKLVPANMPALDNARTAFDQFVKVSDDIVKLSRQNTNVRSFELALRSVPTVTATCDDDLRKLQEALDGESAKATR
ncbi:MAG TPA: hypothetical protein VHC69_34085 [Polyangiaceae bacterium]|nr:hypothetical protein [Polyangiaceae bacterium]